MIDILLFSEYGNCKRKRDLYELLREYEKSSGIVESRIKLAEYVKNHSVTVSDLHSYNEKHEYVKNHKQYFVIIDENIPYEKTIATWDAKKNDVCAFASIVNVDTNKRWCIINGARRERVKYLSESKCVDEKYNLYEV